MTNSTKANFFFLLVSCLWGATFPIIKSVVQTIDPNFFVWVRFTLAALVMLFITLPTLHKIDRPLIKMSLALGLLNSLTYVFQTVGIQYISASRCAFITGICVVMVPLFAWALRLTQLALIDILAAIICLFGLYILTGANITHLGLGDFLVFLCAVTCALSIVFLQEVSKKCRAYSALSFLQIVFTIPIPLALYSFSSHHETLGIFNWHVVGALFFCAILATIVPMFLQTKYQQYTTAARVALIFSLEPVFACLFANFFSHEAITSTIMLGGMIMTVGVMLPVIAGILTRDTKNTV